MKTNDLMFFFLMPPLSTNLEESIGIKLKVYFYYYIIIVVIIYSFFLKLKNRIIQKNNRNGIDDINKGSCFHFVSLWRFIKGIVSFILILINNY